MAHIDWVTPSTRILLLRADGAPNEIPAWLVQADPVMSAVDAVWPNGKFDLIVVWHGMGALDSVSAFLARVHERLEANGRLLLTTYTIPSTRLRGKKGRLIREAGDYIHALLNLHHSSHQRTLSQHHWQHKLQEVGFTVKQAEQTAQPIDFATWSQYQTPQNRIRLQAMLQQAPQKASDFLNPQISSARITFHLQQLTIFARK